MKRIFSNLIPSNISYLDKYYSSPTKDTTIKVRWSEPLGLDTLSLEDWEGLPGSGILLEIERTLP
jgi:hypothetical protein